MPFRKFRRLVGVLCLIFGAVLVGDFLFRDQDHSDWVLFSETTEFPNFSTRSYRHASRPDDFYFESVNIKSHHSMRVVGSRCDNLKIALNYQEGGKKTIVEGILYLSGHVVHTAADKKHRETFLHDKSNLKPLQVDCIPYVKDFRPYLNKGAVFLSGWDNMLLSLRDGPDLFVRQSHWVEETSPRAPGLSEDAAWLAGRYRRVTASTDCPEKQNSFCVHMLGYQYIESAEEGAFYKRDDVWPFSWAEKYTTTYNVFCWNCDLYDGDVVKGVRENLRYLLYSHRLQTYFFVLNGGVMMPATFVSSFPQKIDSFLALFNQ